MSTPSPPLLSSRKMGLCGRRPRWNHKAFDATVFQDHVDNAKKNRSPVRISRHFDPESRQKNQGVEAGGEAAFNVFLACVSATCDRLGLETQRGALLRLGTSGLTSGTDWA